jgi:hypothetical protein
MYEEKPVSIRNELATAELSTTQIRLILCKLIRHIAKEIAVELRQPPKQNAVTSDIQMIKRT